MSQAILGERRDDDRSAQWCVIAEDDDSGTALRAVIDLDPRRRGRAYAGFWDGFGVAGSMPIIALSFTDLLERLVESFGEPCWDGEDLGLGDAYDCGLLKGTAAGAVPRAQCGSRAEAA